MPLPSNACWERLLLGIGVNPVQTGLFFFFFYTALFNALVMADDFWSCHVNAWPFLVVDARQRNAESRFVECQSTDWAACVVKASVISPPPPQSNPGVPSMLLCVYSQGALSVYNWREFYLGLTSPRRWEAGNTLTWRWKYFSHSTLPWPSTVHLPTHTHTHTESKISLFTQTSSHLQTSKQPYLICVHILWYDGARPVNSRIQTVS